MKDYALIKYRMLSIVRELYMLKRSVKKIMKCIDEGKINFVIVRDVDKWASFDAILDDISEVEKIIEVDIND